MHGTRKIFQIISGLTLCTLSIASAFAEYEPNDNYSSFILSYQSTSFATPVCIGGECHEGLSGPQVVFTRQIIPNLALGLSGSYLQSGGKSSTIKSSNGSAFAEVIAGMGPSVDVGGSVAILINSTQLCTAIPDSCLTISDNGADLGVFGKVFLKEDKSVSVTLSYDAVSYQQSANQSIIAFSLVTILAKHHRLALSVDRVRDTSGNAISGGYGFSYSYLVF